MASVFNVANFFIDAAASQEEEFMTNLKLNKMLFFAQAVCLVRHDRLLFVEPICAWQYGPVVPAIYSKYKRYGNKAIKQIDNPDYCLDMTEEETQLLIEVMSKFGQFTAPKLVNMTHVQGSPWEATQPNEEIAPGLIKEYYEKNRLLSDSGNKFVKCINAYTPRRTSQGLALLSKEMLDDWD